jgi:hypothetical protein
VDAHTFTKEVENFKQSLSARKLVVSAFWDRKRALMLECMEQATSETSEVYCETLRNNCVRPFRTKGVEC